MIRGASASMPPRLSSDTRSEEHTSELQSHSDLVCRLLLEKKKKISKSARRKRSRGGRGRGEKIPTGTTGGRTAASSRGTRGTCGNHRIVERTDYGRGEEAA